jgi:hypothetical protein
MAHQLTTRLTTPQMLALLELSTRNHLLALNALGVRWVKEAKR